MTQTRGLTPHGPVGEAREDPERPIAFATDARSSRIMTRIRLLFGTRQHTIPLLPPGGRVGLPPVPNLASIPPLTGAAVAPRRLPSLS